MQKEYFAQRKYYNFPRTNHKIEKPQEDRTVEKYSASSEITVMQEKSANNEELASVKNNPTIKKEKIIRSQKTLNKIHKKKIESTANTTEQKEDLSINYTQLLPHAEIAKSIATGYDSPTKLFIMLIFAFLLPPLAIYIKHGLTERWFWLAFAFCCGAIFLGFLLMPTGVYAGWYLWLPAILIAILNIFEILKG